jgi:hypothetical protein
VTDNQYAIHTVQVYLRLSCVPDFACVTSLATENKPKVRKNFEWPPCHYFILLYILKKAANVTNSSKTHYLASCKDPILKVIYAVVTDCTYEIRK